MSDISDSALLIQPATLRGATFRFANEDKISPNVTVPLGENRKKTKEPNTLYQNQASSIRDEVRHWQQFFLKFKVAQSEAHE